MNKEEQDEKFICSVRFNSREAYEKLKILAGLLGCHTIGNVIDRLIDDKKRLLDLVKQETLSNDDTDPWAGIAIETKPSRKKKGN